MNPVHLDPQKAAQTRFGKRIAHGMLGVSFLNAVLPENIQYNNLNIKFMKPIFLQERIRV